MVYMLPYPHVAGKENIFTPEFSAKPWISLLLELRWHENGMATPEPKHTINEMNWSDWLSLPRFLASPLDAHKRNWQVFSKGIEERVIKEDINKCPLNWFWNFVCLENWRVSFITRGYWVSHGLHQLCSVIILH